MLQHCLCFSVAASGGPAGRPPLQARPISVLRPVSNSHPLCYSVAYATALRRVAAVTPNVAASQQLSTSHSPYATTLPMLQRCDQSAPAYATTLPMLQRCAQSAPDSWQSYTHTQADRRR